MIDTDLITKPGSTHHSPLVPSHNQRYFKSCNDPDLTSETLFNCSTKDSMYQIKSSTKFCVSVSLQSWLLLIIVYYMISFFSVSQRNTCIISLIYLDMHLSADSKERWCLSASRLVFSGDYVIIDWRWFTLFLLYKTLASLHTYLLAALRLGWPEIDLTNSDWTFQWDKG